MNTSTSKALGGYYVRERETLSTVSTLRADLLSLGITNIRAEYDGAGDEGQINDIRCFGDESLTDDITVASDIQQRVEAVLYALLECRHGGWENNDGAFGHFAWRLDPERLEHEHNDRFVDHITSVQMGFKLEVEQDDPDADDESEVLP